MALNKLPGLTVEQLTEFIKTGGISPDMFGDPNYDALLGEGHQPGYFVLQDLIKSGFANQPKGGIGFQASFDPSTFFGNSGTQTGSQASESIPGITTTLEGSQSIPGITTTLEGAGGFSLSSFLNNPKAWAAGLSALSAFTGDNGDLPSIDELGGGIFSSGGVSGQNFIPGMEGFEYNFDALNKLLNASGGGNAGASDFLQGLFDDPSFGELNPEFLSNIEGLQGNQLFNYEEFQDLVNSLSATYAGEVGGNDILDFLLTGGPGGSGFSVNIGGGGGVPQSSIEALLSQLPEFNPRDISTKLPELDPQLAAELNTIKEAQLAQFGRGREDLISGLTADLFGRGIERSTVAGEFAGRAAEGLERTELNILSEDISRRLGIRKDEADRILQSELAKLSTEASTFGDRLRALTGIRTAEIGADASVRSSSAAAAAGAGASIAGDRLRALASIYGSRVGGLSNILGSQLGALTSGFDTQTGGISNFADLYGNLALGESGQEIEKMLGLGQLANERIRTGVSAAGNRNESLLNFLRMQEAIAGRIQGGLIDLEGFNTQRDIARLGGNVDLELGRMNQLDTWDRLINALGIAGGAYWG